MSAPLRVPAPIHRRRGTLRGLVDGDRLFDDRSDALPWPLSSPDPPAR